MKKCSIYFSLILSFSAATINGSAIVTSQITSWNSAFLSSLPQEIASLNSAPELPPGSGLSVVTWTAYIALRGENWKLCAMKFFGTPPPMHGRRRLWAQATCIRNRGAASPGARIRRLLRCRTPWRDILGRSSGGIWRIPEMPLRLTPPIGAALELWGVTRMVR